MHVKYFVVVSVRSWNSGWLACLCMHHQLTTRHADTWFSKACSFPQIKNNMLVLVISRRATWVWNNPWTPWSAFKKVNLEVNSTNTHALEDRRNATRTYCCSIFNTLWWEHTKLIIHCLFLAIGWKNVKADLLWSPRFDRNRRWDKDHESREQS